MVLGRSILVDRFKFLSIRQGIPFIVLRGFAAKGMRP
jgi:hypothetical protein